MEMVDLMALHEGPADVALHCQPLDDCWADPDWRDTGDRGEVHPEGPWEFPQDLEGCPLLRGPDRVDLQGPKVPFGVAQLEGEEVRYDRTPLVPGVD
jgi:hypothetical protein